MAIGYVGGVSGGRVGATGTTSQSLTSLTGGLASAPAEGDFVVVQVSVGTAAAYVSTTLAISGYSAETMLSNTAVTNQSFSQVSYKHQTATPDTSITIPGSGNARNAQRWEVHVFRGVDTTDPAAFITANGSTTGRPNPGAITPGTAGSWILALYASAAGTGAAFTAPTDFATNWLGGTVADTYDVMSGAGYYTSWTSGAYDPAAITAGGTTGSTDSWTAHTIALKPAPETQALTQAGRFDNNQTFYAPTVTPGTTTLSPQLFDDSTDTFYVATATPGAVALTQDSRYDSAQAFYSPTVSSAGAGQTLVPALFNNTPVFYSQTVSPGTVTLAPGLLSNNQAFYAATVSSGLVTLAPNRLDNNNTFFGAVVSLASGGQTLTPTRFNNSAEIYPPIITLEGDVPGPVLATPTGVQAGMRTRRRVKTSPIWIAPPVAAPSDEEEALHLIGLI